MILPWIGYYVADYYNLTGRYPYDVKLEKYGCEASYVVFNGSFEQHAIEITNDHFETNDLKEYNAKMDLMKCVCDKYLQKPSKRIETWLIDEMKKTFSRYQLEGIHKKTSQEVLVDAEKICLHEEEIFERIGIE